MGNGWIALGCERTPLLLLPDAPGSQRTAHADSALLPPGERDRALHSQGASAAAPSVIPPHPPPLCSPSSPLLVDGSLLEPGQLPELERAAVGIGGGQGRMEQVDCIASAAGCEEPAGSQRLSAMNFCRYGGAVLTPPCSSCILVDWKAGQEKRRHGIAKAGIEESCSIFTGPPALSRALLRNSLSKPLVRDLQTQSVLKIISGCYFISLFLPAATLLLSPTAYHLLSILLSL
eukprot:768463-Hanusia_phi.AAC.8